MEDPEVKKALKSIARGNRWDQVMLRGCLIGVFTALGTTIGFALLIAFAAQFVGSFKQLPLIDTFLEQTKLDVLIENQLKKISTETSTTTSTTSSGSQTPTSSSLTYVNTQTGISFTYPSSLSKVSSEGSVVTFSGTTPIEVLELRINQQITLSGNSSQQFITKAGQDRIVINIYEAGAKLDGKEVTNAVFETKITSGSNKFQFVAISEASSPKLAREVFKSIIESVSFNIQ